MRVFLVYWYHLASHTDPFTQGYVGVTCQNDVRKRCHMKGLRGGSTVLHKAFQKYGKENILQDVLQTVDNKQEAYELEQVYRSKPRIGWNLTSGGGLPPDTTGRVDSPEVRKRRGESVRKARMETYFPNKFKGTTGRYTDEQREHLGTFHRGKTISDSHRKAISEKMSGSDSPKAKEVHLVHVDAPENIQSYPCIKVAADTLGIPYQALRSLAQRTWKMDKPSEPSRLGWICLTKDNLTNPVVTVQKVLEARSARFAKIVSDRERNRREKGVGVTPSINS